MSKPKLVAMIPARAGSKRVPDKNVRRLGGHPLLAYSIVTAKRSGVFDAVVVSTDSPEYAEIAVRYGAEIPALRPVEMASATSPDIAWVQHMLATLRARGDTFDCFSILRPTSPFRCEATIQRAWQQFLNYPKADSLRAVEKCSQHPGKMWVIEGETMRPLLQGDVGGVPYHSCQMAALPEIYVQNASLEIAWTRVAVAQGTIAGSTILPFITDKIEGFDINTPEDWWLAEHMLTSGEAQLPDLSS